MVTVQFFKYSQDVFKFVGLWGQKGKTKSFKAQFNRYVVVMLLGCFIPIICISDTYAAIKMGDIALSFTKALYGFAYLVCFHKLAAAAFFNDEIFFCINQLERISHKFQDVTDFYGGLSTYKKMATFGSIAMNLCAVAFLSAPTMIREFPYNPHLPPLNFTKSPNYELMYIYQAIAIVTVSNVMLAYDSVVMVLGCFIPIICISDTISAVRMGNIALSFTKALYGFAYLVCFHKLAAAAFFNDEIYYCISLLERMSHEFEDLTDFYRGLNMYKKMVTVGTVAMNLSAVSFLIAPTVTREFPYNPHLPPLNFTKSPNYELMYVYQAAAIVTVSNVMLAYDSLFCGLMSLCGSVLASISRDTREIDIKVHGTNEAENSLKDIIGKLIEVSNLINRISDIFSFTTITSILYNCTLMALGLFMVSSLPFSDLNCIAMIFVIIVETFQLWIYCYFGQVIINEKQLLQVELYCTKWYNRSKRFKSMLLLTISEAQNERYVKAGRILPLSLRTFTKVLKKAYALYAFLNEAN